MPVTDNAKYSLLERPSRLTTLCNTVGGHTVYVYGDDTDDFAGGGNKVRFYEYLIPDIIAARPDVILSSGSEFSNHIRVSAAVAARLGIRCELLIYSDAPKDSKSHTPNVAAALALGANVRYIGSFAALLKIKERITELEHEGKRVFTVPNGGHAPGAVRAYAEVWHDVMSRLDEVNVYPEAVYLPCASGTTHAGLLLGALQTGRHTPIFSFRVANTERGARRGIKELLGTSPAANSAAHDTQVLDCGKNDYGRPDGDLMCLRSEIYASDGILLDPVYNINAFFGMMSRLTADPGDGSVLYIDTGGYRGNLPC